MDNADKKSLRIEYANRLKKIIYRPLKVTGFCRFDVVNNNIVQLTSKSMLYNTLVIIVADCCVAYLLYSSVSLGTYLKIPDALCVSHFALYANVILLNLTFINRRSGLDLVEHCIKMDCFLGIRETAFMRDVAVRTLVTLFFLIMVMNLGVGIFLYQVYVVPMSIHIVGSLYFFWLFFAYNDYAFALMLFTLNSLRIRYLNVALLKIGDVKEQYIPSQSIFNLLFWNKKFNKLVTFHERASVEEFNRAFRMCFEMINLLEEYYSFPILNGVWTVVVGSFVAVQTFIMRVKNPTAMDNERTYIIVGWVILTWVFLILMAIITDMTPHQIQQTNLICSYIQLKPNKSAKIYKLTKTVLRTIKMRSPVANIYNLFHYDSGFMFRIAASTLVYITVQLQLAFPRLPLNNARLNETSV